MQNVLDFITQNNLIKPGERIGVGVSGGSDSMALVHFLHSVSDQLDIEVVAICVDHGIREESRDEANFVVAKCKEMGVRAYKFRIDAPKLAKERNISLETAARDGRYGVFESLFKKDVVDKIALAHHLSDQAETILMHIFRGSGVSGARGMDAVRDKKYIRPLLTTSKEEILDYVNFNNIDYVDDSSNNDNSYSRNYLRNVILPQITQKWPGAVKAIANFGKAIKEDDDYINSQIYADAIIYEEKEAKIPLSYFMYPSPIIARMIIKALKNIGVVCDFEKSTSTQLKNLQNRTTAKEFRFHLMWLRSKIMIISLLQTEKKKFHVLKPNLDAAKLTFQKLENLLLKELKISNQEKMFYSLIIAKFLKQQFGDLDVTATCLQNLAEALKTQIFLD